MIMIEEIMKDKYQLNEKQIKKLNRRLDIAKCLGLDELLLSIETNDRKRLDFITELNIIYQIYNELDERGINFELIYEQTTQNGAPDLKICIEDIVFWIQIKRFNTLKIDNINNKVIMEISKQLESIEIPLFYNMNYSETLELTDSDDFINKLYGEKDKIYDGNTINILLEDRYIEIEFYKAENLKLKHLQLGMYGGEARWISNETEEHIKNSILKGCKSLGQADSSNINIIVTESGMNFDSIDIGNVLYGDEQIHIKNGVISESSRAENGIANQLKDKLNYFILLKRKEKELFTRYDKNLFVINNDELSIGSYFSIDRVYNNKTIIN